VSANAAQPFATEREGHAVTRFLRLIRFSHTIFALPFALASLVVAANGWPPPRVLLLVLFCMVAARTAAMLFNRFVDWEIDQRNPRTQGRHLLADKRAVLTALVVSSALFLAGAAMINRLTLVLSPVALVFVFLYSLTKRWTAATHFFLGVALAIAPVAAWVAQTNAISLPPVLLALAVICWVAGFDLIYATQDFEFDQREGLRSLVVHLGIPASLRLAQWLHFAMFMLLMIFGLVANLGAIYFVLIVPVALALAYEHRSAQRLDLAAINRAFFQSNAFVSALFLVAVCADRLG